MVLDLRIAREWISGQFRQQADKAILFPVAKYKKIMCKRMFCEDWMALYSLVKDRESVEFQAKQVDSGYRHLTQSFFQANFQSLLNVLWKVGCYIDTSFENKNEI